MFRCQREPCAAALVETLGGVSLVVGTLTCVRNLHFSHFTSSFPVFPAILFPPFLPYYLLPFSPSFLPLFQFLPFGPHTHYIEMAMPLDLFIGLLEGERRKFSQDNHEPSTHQLHRFSTCCKLLKQENIALSGRRSSTRHRRRTARDNLKKILSLSASIFTLCGFSVSSTDLARRSHLELIPKLQDWWRAVDHPSRLEAKAQRLCALEGIHYSDANPQGPPSGGNLTLSSGVGWSDASRSKDVSSTSPRMASSACNLDQNAGTYSSRTSSALLIGKAIARPQHGQSQPPRTYTASAPLNLEELRPVDGLVDGSLQGRHARAGEPQELTHDTDSTIGSSHAEGTLPSSNPCKR